MSVLLVALLWPSTAAQQEYTVSTTGQLRVALYQIAAGRRAAAAEFTAQRRRQPYNFAAEIVLTESNYIIDDALVVDFYEEYSSANSSVTFRPERGATTFTCTGNSALVIRGQYGIGQWLVDPPGSLTISNCKNASVIVETSPQEQVQAARETSRTFESTPLALLSGFTWVNNVGAQYGAGLLVRGAMVNIFHCQFVGNQATRGGGAMYLENMARVNMMVNCSFTDNKLPAGVRSTRGGALAVAGGSCLQLVLGTTFSRNYGGIGGAIHLSVVGPRCGTLPFSMDRSGQLRGQVVEGPPVPGATTFQGCRFMDNRAAGEGGAVFVQLEAGPSLGPVSHLVRSSDSTFTRNQAVFRGGALAFSASLVNVGIQLVNTGINLNQAGWSGGALWLNSSTSGQLIVSTSTITNNMVTASGGGNESLVDVGSGGAVAAAGGLITVDIEQGSVISHNQAPRYGGGLYCLGCGALTVGPAQFVNNTAGVSGGAIAAPLQGGATQVVGAIFRDNIVDSVRGPPPQVRGVPLACGQGGGGAICVQPLSQGVAFRNATFENNTAAYGGGVYVDNDECVILAGDPSFCPVNFVGESSTWSRNRAARTGGAIYISDGRTQPQLSRCLQAGTAGDACRAQWRGNQAGSGAADVGTMPARLSVNLPSLPAWSEQQPVDVVVGFFDPFDRHIVAERMEVRVAKVEGLGKRTFLAAATAENEDGIVLRNISSYGNVESQTLEVQGVVADRVVAQVQVQVPARPGVRSFTGCSVGEVLAGVHRNSCRSCESTMGTTFSFNPSNSTCDRCPANAFCEGGATILPLLGGIPPELLPTQEAPTVPPSEVPGVRLTAMTAEDYRPLRGGFWHSHPRSVQIHPCPLKGACAGNISAMRILHRELYPMLGAYPSGAVRVIPGDPSLVTPTPASAQVVSTYLASQCAEGYMGVLCGSCQSGWGRVGQSCRHCLALGWSWVVFLVVFLVHLIFLSVLFLLRFKQQQKQQHRKLEGVLPDKAATVSFRGNPGDVAVPQGSRRWRAYPDTRPSGSDVDVMANVTDAFHPAGRSSASSSMSYPGVVHVNEAGELPPVIRHDSVSYRRVRSMQPPSPMSDIHPYDFSSDGCSRGTQHPAGVPGDSAPARPSDTSISMKDLADQFAAGPSRRAVPGDTKPGNRGQDITFSLRSPPVPRVRQFDRQSDDQPPRDQAQLTPSEDLPAATATVHPPSHASRPVDPASHQRDSTMLQYSYSYPDVLLEQWRREGRASALQATLQPCACAQAATAILLILMVYVQMLGVLLRIDAPWPHALREFLRYVDFTQAWNTWISLDCLAPPAAPVWDKVVGRMVINVVLPVCMVVVLWGLYFLCKAMVGCDEGQKMVSCCGFDGSFTMCLSAAAVIGLFYYTTITTTVLSLFSCVEVDRSPSSTPYRGYLAATGQFWTQEYSTRCFEDRHLGLAGTLGFLGLGLLVVGLPAMVALLLLTQQDKLKNGKFRFRFGMLYESYQPQYHVWFVVQYVLLLALSLVTESIRGYGAGLQIALYMGVVTVFLSVQLAHMPYLEPLLNGLTVLTWSSALLTAYCALSFESNQVGHRADEALQWVAIATNIATLTLLLTHLIGSVLGIFFGRLVVISRCFFLHCACGQTVQGMRVTKSGKMNLRGRENWLGAHYGYPSSSKSSRGVSDAVV